MATVDWCPQTHTNAVSQKGRFHSFNFRSWTCTDFKIDSILFCIWVFPSAYPQVNSEKPRQQMGKISWGFGPNNVVNKPKCLAFNRNGNFWVRYFLQYLYLHSIWFFTLTLMGIITCRETTFLWSETPYQCFSLLVLFFRVNFLIILFFWLAT